MPLPFVTWAVATVAALQGVAIGVGVTGAALMACQMRKGRGR